MNLLSAHLAASFCYLPARNISNQYLVENNSLSEATEELSASIKKYSGIDERRYSREDEAASDLATRAILPLILQDSSLKNEIGALLVATTSGDYPSPATANFLHRSLQLNPQVHCLDIASSCTSYLSAFRAAFGFLASNANTIVVAAEVKHKSLCKSDIRTLSLFSDGAGGVYLKNSLHCNSQFLFAYQEVNSELADNICIPVGGGRNWYSLENKNDIYLRFLEPKKMFLHTVKSLVTAVLSMYSTYKEKFVENELNLIFIHQANKNIIQEVRKKLPKNIAKKIPSLMSDVGNMVCASLPVLRVRVKFLQALICFYKEPFKKEELIRVFTDLCAKHSNFSYNRYDGGIIFKFFFNNEDLFIYDDGCVNLEDCWLTRIAEDEFYFLLENVDKDYFSSEGQSVDFWLSAGGGFQTVGVIHSH